MISPPLKHQKFSSDIVIEVRGGCPVAIYTDSKDDHRIILIDWDNESEKKTEFQKGQFLLIDLISSMPDDTKTLYEKAISQ